MRALLKRIYWWCIGLIEACKPQRCPLHSHTPADAETCLGTLPLENGCLHCARRLDADPEGPYL
jgi:hypothetical protein